MPLSYCIDAEAVGDGWAGIDDELPGVVTGGAGGAWTTSSGSSMAKFRGFGNSSRIGFVVFSGLSSREVEALGGRSEGVIGSGDDAGESEERDRAGSAPVERSPIVRVGTRAPDSSCLVEISTRPPRYC